jgi:hypothetical protein
MREILLLILLVPLITCTALGQTISYNDLAQSSKSLKSELLNNSQYFSNGTFDLPYFQGKFDGLYIKFYDTTGIHVIFNFKSQSDYLNLVREIQNKANFRFKYCTDFDTPVVYNYETNNKNKIRFNFSETKISVQYPSKLSSFLKSRSEFITVFVCLSKNAYAYHTNLRCEGLGNCNSEIAKSHIKEAKKYNYRICEICTDDKY